LKPAAFEYRRATSVEVAIDQLTELGDDAKLLAGGQSLVPMMNFRLVRPSALVDIAHVPDL
jgi:aerobic carbon-monoxide dehydrogenase medium subunit